MARILLVDDAAFMRKVIKDTLSKAGYTDLHEAVDGADAVEKYNSLKPDLVLMDITMPNMDGLEALKATPTWSCAPPWARRPWSSTRSAQGPRTSSSSPSRASVCSRPLRPS